MKDKSDINIFFCGSVLTYDGLIRYKGEAPSASQWTRGLLQGLKLNNIVLKTFSPIWDSMFPKGYLFPGKKKYLDDDFSAGLLKYINIAGIRSYSIANNLFRSIEEQIKKGNIPTAIINYNSYPRFTYALRKLKKKYPEIKWINLILDLDDPTIDQWKSFNKSVLNSDGCVFLSWWGYKNAPVKNKLHLDSGWVGDLPILIENKDITFLYAGKMLDDGSLTELIEAIELVDDSKVKFEFYGKGTHQGLIDLAKRDKRIILKGFVTDNVLDEACRKATAFLSPRDMSNQENRMVFPSKILVYLKYQKPIISPRLPGLSPDYESILITPQNNTPQEWADSMKSIVTMDENQKLMIQFKSKELLEKKKWTNQAKSLVDFIVNIDSVNSLNLER